MDPCDNRGRIRWPGREADHLLTADLLVQGQNRDVRKEGWKRSHLGSIAQAGRLTHVLVFLNQ